MYSVTLNWNQIAWETYKAYLIKIPHTKYMIWFPKSLTQTTRNGKQLRIVIKDDFEYKIFRETKTKKIEEVVGHIELLEMFNYQFDIEVEPIEDLLDD